MKPSCQILFISAAIASLFTGFCVAPAGAQDPPAAEKKEWPEFTKTYSVTALPLDYYERPDHGGHAYIPPGEVLAPDAVKELPAADLDSAWKLRDGRKVEFKYVGFTYSRDKVKGTTAVFALYTQIAGAKPVELPVASIHVDEYPRLQRVVWHRYYKSKAFRTAANDSLDVVKPCIFRFAGSGLPIQERSGFANRPPGPEVAEPAVAGEPLWPAVQKWKRKNGQEVEFSMYGWHWQSSSDPLVELEVLLPGAAAITNFPATELDPAETDRLLAAMWRRHYHIKTIRGFPHPDPTRPPDWAHDSLFSLTRPWCSGIRIPFPGLPMPDCRLLPAPAVLPERTAIPPVEQGGCGILSNTCLHGCIAAYFLWWDANNWLPLERKGNDKDKSHWLHKQLGRDLRTSTRGGIGWGDVTKGLGDLSTKYLGGKYAFQLCSDYDYRPANLARLATGMNGLILEVAVYKGTRYAGSHAILLLSAAPDGTATISAWGLVLRGKWTECPQIKKTGARGDKRALLPVYEFIMENKASLPKVLAQNDIRFILGSRQWDSLFLIVPQLCVAPQKKPSR